VSAKDAELERMPPPAAWARPPGGLVGHLTFSPGKYPGLAIVEPAPDWSGYDRLVFEAYSERADPVQLVLRIHDIHHNNAFRDRYNHPVTIAPGRNRVVIPLADVRAAPEGREMDLTAIRGLALFALSPPVPFSLYLDAFRLEHD
jgi:hypothetical protein